MSYLRRFTQGIGLALLLLSISLTSCSSVTLHPISQEDIITAKKGTVITAPKDGYFLSDVYLSEVAKARVK